MRAASAAALTLSTNQCASSRACSAARMSAQRSMRLPGIAVAAAAAAAAAAAEVEAEAEAEAEAEVEAEAEAEEDPEVRRRG